MAVLVKPTFSFFSGRMASVATIFSLMACAILMLGGMPAHAQSGGVITAKTFSAPAVNDVEQVQEAPNTTGGTFTLTFGGDTTAALAYNASAATVQAALQGLASIGGGNATVTVYESGIYAVTFAGSLGGALQPLLTGTPSLTGGSNTLTISQIICGMAAPGRAAYGDGSHDDTAELQADIDYAITNLCALEIEPGCYNTSAALVIAAPINSVIEGLKITGVGGVSDFASTICGGVEIQLTSGATSAPAIIEVGPGKFRHLIIEDLGLVSNVASDGTTYGLEFANQGFTEADITRVDVTGCGTAFATVQDTDNERDGEAVNLTQCQADTNCNTFYSNNSGQALTHTIVDCGGTLNNGGTAIRIGAGGLGFGLTITGSGWSINPGSLRNTFIENDGISGVVDVLGGRDEHIDTEIGYNQGSYGDTGQIVIRGVEFTSYSGQYPLIDGSLGNDGNGDWTNVIADCQIEAASGNPSLSITTHGSDNSATYFDRDTFTGFANELSGLSITSMGIVLSQCRTTTPSSSKLVPESTVTVASGLGSGTSSTGIGQPAQNAIGTGAAHGQTGIQVVPLGRSGIGMGVPFN